MKYKAHIEFARSVKSRQELNDFEKYCRKESTLKKHFLGVVGRRFVFGFAKESDRNSFYFEAETMMAKNGLITERTKEYL